MPIYQYVAINEKGRKTRGQMNASNQLDLDERLKDLGFDLVESKQATMSRLARLARRSLRTRDLIEFCLDMEELIRANVPILDALSDIRDATRSGVLRDTLSDVVQDVANGEVLSQALSHHPRVFSDVFVGVISAGERSGNLEDAFHHLTDHLKWTDDMSRRLRSAARYPIFVLVTTMGMAIALMMFLVPELSRFLTSLSMELPWSTKLLLATADAVRNYWWLIIGVPFMIAVILPYLYTKNDRWARTIDRYVYYVPVVGPTLKKIAISRFAHFFTVLYKSGVGILDCLDVSQRVVGNRTLAESIHLAKERIETGASLTAGLRATGEFPDLVLRIVKVGEESGNLDRALASVTYFYDREVDDAVQSLVGSVRPALTLVVGAILAWIILSVLGPIYDSFSQLPI
jgi:type IV pilus assembly protein PilC